MLQRLYKITFKEYRQIDLELWNEINDSISGRQDGSYGEILFPTKDHFTKKMAFDIADKILVALYADDDQSAAMFSADFSYFLIDSEHNFMLEFCWNPLVHVSFKGQNHVEGNVFEGILDKYDDVIRQPECCPDSFSFRLKCPIQEFDVLVSDILDEFKSEGYGFDVEYYF